MGYSLDVILTTRYTLELYFFHARCNFIRWKTNDVNVSQHREILLAPRCLRAPNLFDFYVAINVPELALHFVALRTHDGVIKWKHFPRYWPFVRGIHRSPVNSPHKGQWRGALVFSLIRAWIWVNNNKTGDLRRRRAHYVVMGSLVLPVTRLRKLNIFLISTMFPISLGNACRHNFCFTHHECWHLTKNLLDICRLFFVSK